jgi:hypothetical protein
MTSIAFEAADLISLVSNIRDRESLQIVSRVVQAQTTIMEAQLAQFKQLQGALQERMGGAK